MSSTRIWARKHSATWTGAAWEVITEPAWTTDGSETVTVASTVSPALANVNLMSFGVPRPASIDSDLTTPTSPGTGGTRATFVPT